MLQVLGIHQIIFRRLQKGYSLIRYHYDEVDCWNYWSTLCLYRTDWIKWQSLHISSGWFVIYLFIVFRTLNLCFQWLVVPLDNFLSKVLRPWIKFLPTLLLSRYFHFIYIFFSCKGLRDGNYLIVSCVLWWMISAMRTRISVTNRDFPSKQLWTLMEG